MCIKEVVFVFCLNCILKLNNNKKAHKLVGLLFILGCLLFVYETSSLVICLFVYETSSLVICLRRELLFMYFQFVHISVTASVYSLNICDFSFPLSLTYVLCVSIFKTNKHVSTPEWFSLPEGNELEDCCAATVITAD